MQETITAGIGVNVTLLFSGSHYLRTADAYIRALQRRPGTPGWTWRCRQWPQCLRVQLVWSQLTGQAPSAYCPCSTPG